MNNQTGKETGVETGKEKHETVVNIEPLNISKRPVENSRLQLRNIIFEKLLTNRNRKIVFILLSIITFAFSPFYIVHSFNIGGFIEGFFTSVLFALFLILIITCYFLFDYNDKLRNTRKMYQESEKNNFHISENAVEMISRHSLDGKYLYVSPSCKYLLGYEPEELIGVDPYELFHPDSIESIRQTHSNILNKPDIDISTYKIRRKDGKYIWVETSNKTINDLATNQPVEILCVSRDITYKKEENELLEKMIEFAEELQKPMSKSLKFDKILENLLYLSQAKVGALTLIDEESGKFKTQAVIGIDAHITNLSKILGFNLIGYEWGSYNANNELLGDRIMTHFATLSELIYPLLSMKISHAVESILNIGSCTVIKIMSEGKMIGDFTLVMPKGKLFKNDNFVEIYSRQIDLYISRMFAEGRLISSEQRLLSAQSIAHLGNWDLKLSDKTIWASIEAYKIYGLEPGDGTISLEKVQNLVSKEYRESLDRALVMLIKNGHNYDEKFKIFKKDTGEERFVQERAYLVKDSDGKPIYVKGTLQDITEFKKAETEIEFLSFHDQLTGLFNRRYYDSELIALDNKHNLPLTIVMGDLNGLKLVNDSFGHTIGDELLVRVARVMKSCCRDNDIIARIGGDEFVILMPNTDFVAAETIISKMIELSSQEKVGAIGLSISFGFETKVSETQKFQDVFKDTEDKMYRNKLCESTSNRNKTIDLILSTLYEKNPREMLHSKRVAEICALIADNMKLTKDEVKQVYTAGLMHDIGKIGIDEKILNKPKNLVIDEWKDIERHTEIGYRILSSVNEFSEIAEHVLSHHERIDGKGYPRGLKGEEISLHAKIIAVADAFDAMTCDRPYREIMTESQAIEEIIKYRGTQFDNKVVDSFLECASQGRLQIC